MSRRTPVSLRTTRQEQASGLLSSLLVVLGSLTFLLFVVWIAQHAADSPYASLLAKINLIGRAPPAEQHSGSSGEWETSVPSEPESGNESQPPSESMAQRLTTVSSLASSHVAELDTVGNSGPKGTGENGPWGEDRRVGPPGPPSGILVPPWERWEIRFAAVGLDEYARQLDSLGVELGALGNRHSPIDYARDLSQPSPRLRQGKPAADSRLRFISQSGPLRAADRALAQKAGISTEGRTVCQFYSSKAESQLAELELAALRGRPLSAVRRTLFGIRREGQDYKFFVQRVEFADPGSLAPL